MVHAVRYILVLNCSVCVIVHSGLQNFKLRIMVMMNCFCGIIDRRKAFSLISSQDHCQRSSRSRISDTPRAGFEPVQNLSSGFVKWSCFKIIYVNFDIEMLHVRYVLCSVLKFYSRDIRYYIRCIMVTNGWTW